jgi:hypothetical protein
MMIGRNAILGIGKPTEMIGSKNQCASRERDIATASKMPPTAAMKKPAMARYIVSARLIQRSPSTAS